MAATSQPYRHNNAITAFTIWGNTFAGSRWGRINSLGRATYGRLPLNSQGVPSKLPLVQLQLHVRAAHPDLFDLVLAIGIGVPHRGGGVLGVAGLDLDSRLSGFVAVLDHDLLVLQFKLVVAGLQLCAADHGRLKERYGERLGAGEGHPGQQTYE